MTRTISQNVAQPAFHSAVAAVKRRRLAHWVNRGRLWAVLYLLMAPTLITMAIFGYYPKLEVVVKAFYRWEPGTVEYFIGLDNFRQALADPIFWHSFKVVAIMLAANLIKMWPAIFTAIALHRLLSDRWRYLYQVLFVVPMVIPSLVWLLVWKSFYDPDFGLLNRLLNATGLMGVLAWLDGVAGDPGVMPRLAATLQPVVDNLMTPIFGSRWGMLLFGAMLLTVRAQGQTLRGRWSVQALLVAAMTMPGALMLLGQIGSVRMLLVGLLAIGWIAVMIRLMPRSWIIWSFWLLVGIWALWGRLFYLPLLTVAALAIGAALGRLANRFTADAALAWMGWCLLGVGALLVGMTTIWTAPTGQFVTGAPAWLGHRDLVLPSLIFWGFPWVGTVGVLIYLAGLQQIPQEVYEAAELDGVGPVRKLFQIELPLIMAAVRINLIFMTIATLTGYETYLILLGSSGGPGNVGMVPGLYMYSTAFEENRFGYACALGMVLFVMILLLTVLYQRYVKVDK